MAIIAVIVPPPIPPFSTTATSSSSSSIVMTIIAMLLLKQQLIPLLPQHALAQPTVAHLVLLELAALRQQFLLELVHAHLAVAVVEQAAVELGNTLMVTVLLLFDTEMMPTTANTTTS